MNPAYWVGVATLVSRNLVPVAGMVFLGWNPVNLVVLYFADYLLDLVACFLMLLLLDPEVREAARKVEGAGDWAKTIFGILIAAVFLLAAFAFVFGMPVFFAAASEIDYHVLDDPGFFKAVGIHLMFASFNFLVAYRFLRELRRAHPEFRIDAAVKGRFEYVTGRWLAVYVAGLFLPFAPFLMVVAYCAATIYSEIYRRPLFPDSA